MKTSKKWVFPLILGIYAAVFLIGAAIGLNYLWDYMADFEATRPATALKQYAANLNNPNYIAEKALPGLTEINPNLQDKEACLNVLRDTVKDGVTYAKNISKSNDSKYVYTLLLGKQVVGSFTMEQRYDEQTDLSPWAVTEESFDFSYLMTEAKSFTIPAEYQLVANGTVIGEEFLIDNKIPYPLLNEFYSDYTLPYLHSYTVGPFLGEPQFTLLDKDGNKAAFQDSWDDTLPGCTQEMQEDLDTIATDFIRHYVNFVSKANNDTTGNYEKLCQFVEKGGQLQKHFYKALDGLYWVPNLHASLVSLDIHSYVNLGDNRYLCDLTYVVNTRDHTGQVQKTENWKIVFTATSNGLKAENMIPHEK